MPITFWRIIILSVIYNELFCVIMIASFEVSKQKIRSHSTMAICHTRPNLKQINAIQDCLLSQERIEIGGWGRGHRTGRASKNILHERNCQYISCLKWILWFQRLMSSNLYDLLDRIFNQVQLIYHLQIF